MILFGGIALLAGFGEAGAREMLLAEQIKQDFVSHVAGDWDEYEVCEVVSKPEDKVAFLKRSFGLDLFSKAEAYETKDVFVKREPDASELHLGILVVHYSTEKAASKILSRLKKRDRPYFEGTMVLTRYAARRTGKSVVAVYSEKFRDARVQAFLDRCEKN